MDKLYLWVIAAFLITTPAFAAALCERGPSHMQMAGQDMDELRCEMALAQEHIGALQMTILSLQSKVAILQSDLANAQKKSDDEKKSDGAAPK